MICPKCGFEQPESPECLRCGIIVSRYKGPVLGEIPPPAALPRTADPVTADPGSPATRADPPPTPESGGTLYAGPPPVLAAAGGGTYAGPMPTPGVPTFSSVTGPTYRGTFEVGKILGETFSVYFANFIPFLILTTIAYLPVLVFSAWQSTLQPGLLAALAQLLSGLVTLVCGPLATAVVTYGVFHQLRGLSLSVGDCLRAGLAALPPIVGLALYQGILEGLAALACLIPGIMLAVQWAVAIPAAVEERPGVTGAVNRSAYLTDGFRWSVFGVLMVLWVLGFGVGLVLLVMVGRDPAAPGKLSFLSNLVEVPVVGLSATATAVMYYRLRSIKESIDVDQIASVFA